MTRVRAIADIAAAMRGRRLDLGLTQEELAGRCGASRKWLNGFERGLILGAPLVMVLRAAEALGLVLEIGIEEGPDAGHGD